jgi:hypothetical protein
MNISTYTARNKKYYETHKEKIKQKRQQNKSWLAYYEKNKEKLKSNQRKYYEKKKILIRRKKEEFIPDIELLELVKYIHYTIITNDDEIEIDMYTVYKPYINYIYSKFYLYEDAAMDMFPVLKEHLKFLYEEGY